MPSTIPTRAEIAESDKWDLTAKLNVDKPTENAERSTPNAE
jgi:hypothetical protein